MECRLHPLVFHSAFAFHLGTPRVLHKYHFEVVPLCPVMMIFRLQYHSIARCQSVMWLILLPTRSWTYTMKQQSSYSMNDLIPRTEFLKILKCDSPVYWMVTVCNYCVSVAAHSYIEHQKMQGTVSWDIQPYYSEQYLPVEWTAQDLLRPVCCLVLLRLQWSSVYVKSIIWDLLYHIKLKPMH